MINIYIIYIKRRVFGRMLLISGRRKWRTWIAALSDFFSKYENTQKSHVRRFHGDIFQLTFTFPKWMANE